jgi:hypothetical protein
MPKPLSMPAFGDFKRLSEQIMVASGARPVPLFASGLAVCLRDFIPRCANEKGR